jgi:hypothetical protein
MTVIFMGGIMDTKFRTLHDTVLMNLGQRLGFNYMLFLLRIAQYLYERCFY